MVSRKFCLWAILLLPIPALAGPKKKSLHDEMTGQNYGMAGCGLGSVLIGDKPGMVQIFAATSNDISGNQTFGISSGTLNCEDRPDSNSAFRQKLDQYVVGNHNQLQNDIAKASGESITALETMGNCADSGQLGTNLQARYASIFADTENEKVSAKIYEIITNNSQCGV